MSLSRLGLGPGCGLLFLPLYAGAVFVPELPESGYSDARVLALHENGAPFLVLAACLALGGVAFLVFLADLHRRLRVGDDGALPTLALGGGLLYVAALFLAGTFWTGYAGGGGGPLEDPPPLADSVTLARVLTDMGFGVLLVFGLAAAAVLVVATSVAGRRGGVLPPGLAVSGYVIAPLLLAGFTWIPQFLVPLWVLAVSAHLLRAGRPAERVPAAG